MSDDSSDPNEHSTAPAQEVSLRLVLLDAQVVDCDDLPIGRVDDLEIDTGATGSPEVAALLIGQRHLAPRIGGLSGALLAGIAEQLAHDSSGGRVPAERVARWTEMPQLVDRLADAPVAGLEKWLSSRVVRRLPGSDDEGI